MKKINITLNIIFFSVIFVTTSSHFCFSTEKAEKIDTETKMIIETQYKQGLFSRNIEIADIEFEIREGVGGIIKKDKFKKIDVRKPLERLTDSKGRELVILYDKEKAKQFIISKKIGDDVEEPKLSKKEIKEMPIKNAAQVIQSGTRIYFFDDSGNPIGSKELPERASIVFSKDGNVYGIRRAVEFGEKGPIKTEFKLYDKQGNLLWATDAIYDDPFWVSSSNNGIAVWSTFWGENILYFFNENGVIKKTDPLGESVRCDFSLNGELFAVGADDFKGDGSLLLFKNNGEIVLHKKSNESIKNVYLSSEGDHIVSVKYDSGKREKYIELINKKGDPVFKHKIERVGNYKIDMSRDDTKIAVAGSSGKLYYVDTKSGPSVTWEYSAPPGLKFRDLTISSDGNLIAGALSAQGPFDEKSRPRLIYLFNSKGKILQKIEYDNHTFTDWDEVPQPVFSLDNKKLLVSLKTEIKSYNMNELLKVEGEKK